LCLLPLFHGEVVRYPYPVDTEQSTIGCFTEESLAASILSNLITFYCLDWYHYCTPCGLEIPCLGATGTFNRYINTGPNPPTCFYAYGKKRSIDEDVEFLLDHEIARENCATCPENIFFLTNMSTYFLQKGSVGNASWNNPEFSEEEPAPNDFDDSETNHLFQDHPQTVSCVFTKDDPDAVLHTDIPTPELISEWCAECSNGTIPDPEHRELYTGLYPPPDPEVPNPPEPEVPNPPEPEVPNPPEPEPEVPNPPEPEPEVPNPPEPEVPNPPEPEPEVPNPPEPEVPNPPEPEPEPEVPYPQPQS